MRFEISTNTCYLHLAEIISVKLKRKIESSFANHSCYLCKRAIKVAMGLNQKGFCAKSASVSQLALKENQKKTVQIFGRRPIKKKQTQGPTLTAYLPSCRCSARSPGRKFPLPLRHVPNFETVFDRSNTVQLFVSFDWEVVAGGNVRLEIHCVSGVVVDFSHEAKIKISH